MNGAKNFYLCHLTIPYENPDLCAIFMMRSGQIRMGRFQLDGEGGYGTRRTCMSGAGRAGPARSLEVSCGKAGWPDSIEE